MPALPIAQEDVRVAPAIGAADARGFDFNPGIGQGLERLGSEGSRLAADANRIQFMQEKNNAISRAAITASNMHLGWTDYASDLKAKMPNDGGDYTGQLLQKIDEDSGKAIAAEPNPFGQKILTEHLASIRTALGEQAKVWQSETMRSNRKQEISDSITQNAQLLENDPTQYKSSLDTMLGTINQLDSVLHPTDRSAFAAAAKQAYMEGASRGFIRADPQNALNVLTGATPQPPNSIPAKIKSAALDAGVDPQIPLAISSFETGGTFNPDAQNPKSSAHGLFQMTKDTANYYMDGMDRNNPDDQIKAGIKLTIDNQKSMQSMLGRPPTATETYAAHLLGASGSVNLVRAPPDEPMIDLVSKYDPKNAAATVANNGFTGKTVGQVRDQLNQWMTGAMRKTAGLAAAPQNDSDAAAKVQDLPPFLAAATPQERDAFIAHAQALVNRKQSDQRVAVESQVQDFKANMSIGNDAPMPTMNDVVAAYGKKGVEMYQDLQQWQQYGHDYGSMKTGTFEQNEALVEARNPPPGAPAEQIMRYEGLKRVRDDINQQRLQQPLESAAASGAYNIQPIDWSDPSKIGDQIKSRALVAVKVSQDYGTNLTMLTHQEQEQMSQLVQNGKTSDIAGVLKGIKQGSPDARTYMTTLGQLANDHMVPAVAGAIMEKQSPIQMKAGGFWGGAPEMQNQEDVATTMLDGWRAMNPVKGAKETEGKAMRLPLPKGGELEKEFAAQVGNAFGTDARSYQAAFESAKAYYVGSAMKTNKLGEDWTGDKKELFDRGITASTGGIIDFNGMGKVAAPWGMPPDKFNTAMASAIPAAVRASGSDPADFPVGRQQLVQIGDGRYALASGTGLVPGKNGGPIVVDLNASPPPPVSAPAPADNRGKRTFVDDDRRIK